MNEPVAIPLAEGANVSFAPDRKSCILTFTSAFALSGIRVHISVEAAVDLLAMLQAAETEGMLRGASSRARVPWRATR